MHETPLNSSIATLISGSHKLQSQDFPTWTEANFTHPQGYAGPEGTASSLGNFRHSQGPHCGYGAEC